MCCSVSRNVDGKSGAIQLIRAWSRGLWELQASCHIKYQGITRAERLHSRYTLNASLASFPFPFPTTLNFYLGSPFLWGSDCFSGSKSSTCALLASHCLHPSGHSDRCEEAVGMWPEAVQSGESQGHFRGSRDKIIFLLAVDKLQTGSCLGALQGSQP